MSTPVNLNKARKAKAKADKLVRSAQNRTKFGQTKAERQAQIQQEQRSEKALDGKKRGI